MSDSADLAEIEEYIEFVDQKHEARVDDTVKPRLDDLETRADDAAEDRDDLRDQVEDLQQTVAVLDQRLEGIAGLADDQSSNPQKRVADLREAMIRRAEAREDSEDNPRVQMWWEEVHDLFADYGHGDVSKPDCYKAMSDATDAPGFAESTKVNDLGNEVKAIRLNLAALRDSTARRNPTTGTGDSDPTSHAGSAPAEGDD